MSQPSPNKSLPSRRRPDRGASTLEAIVAFTLLSSVLAMATPLVVKHGQLLTSHRDYQLALEELDNQLDRLSALPDADLPAAVAKLAPSTLAADKLPGAELKGDLEPAQFGRRLTLRLSWEAPHGRTNPVCLAAWVYPKSPAPQSDARQEGQP